MSSLQLSVMIAAWNEGEALWRTVASCRAACAGLAHEIIVVDDGSTDGSAKELERHCPGVTVVRSTVPRGTAAPKHHAATMAAGETLLFLDAHCSLDAPAMRRLLDGVEASEGQAILVPQLAELEPSTWQAMPGRTYGFAKLDLLTFDYEPVRRRSLPPRPPFLETSALAGGCCMMPRELYQALGGFDGQTIGRALEDVDLGLRAWLYGYAVLCDPEVLVGHWLRAGDRDRYDVAQTLANKLRIAYKNFDEPTWRSWRSRLFSDMPHLAEPAERIFDQDRPSAKSWRASNLARRQHDEAWFAKRFGLSWPR